MGDLNVKEELAAKGPKPLWECGHQDNLRTRLAILHLLFSDSYSIIQAPETI